MTALPKTRNAFAFRDFDGKRILSRPYFRQWREKFHVDDNQTDAEILAALTATDSDDFTELEKKNKILQEICNGLSELYDMIQKRHADYQKGRLENYRRRVMKKIVDFPASVATPFQARIGREQNLLGFYTVTVLPGLNDFIAYMAVLLGHSEKLLQAAYRRRFGERLKAAREKAGLSREELSKKINVTANGFGLYETGKRDISTMTLIRLAQTLKVSSDWLIGLS